MQEKETHGRENKRKPSVEMDMHGGAKNRNWLFTRHVSELTYPQNTLPLHGKCYFSEQAVNCRRTSELRSCGAADLMEMRSCGPHGFADLRICGAGDLRSCGPADLSGQKKLKIFQSVKIEILASGFCPLSFQSYVWILALEFLYHFNDLCCLWKT